MTLDTLAVKTAFLEVNGSGDLDKGIKLTGSIDLAALELSSRISLILAA